MPAGFVTRFVGEEYDFTSYHRKNMSKEKDPIVQSVITQFEERSKVGIEKYGTTLEQNNKDNFKRHMKQELMDALLYLEKEDSLDHMITRILKVTRFEVIDKKGRSYVVKGIKNLELSLQDDDRTLKVFISE